MHETAMNEPEKPYPVQELLNREGRLVFTHRFESEGQYALVITGPDQREAFRVYALEEDLFGLRPYRGDLHVHSFRSDGKESPAVVAAHYRQAGFDFLALTDHERYEPSLEMIAAYRDAPVDLRLIAGEEVHPPGNGAHYLHAGGRWSVNGLIRENPGGYRAAIQRLAETLAIPAGINREEYASCVWVSREIRRAGGLAVMVHPYWIHGNAYHIRETMARVMLKSGLFDAFEVIGGQTLEENQLQASLWQDVREEGVFVPPLGNSDSHGTADSEWFNTAKTIVFAAHSGQDALFAAIRAGKTAALEQYSGEPKPRIYGRQRYAAFALFLLEEYFPLHDELCFEEGRLMKAYVCGNSEAKNRLQTLQGQCELLLQKYFF
jgi:predicted metal-dependent phosphoesterase TrpH